MKIGRLPLIPYFRPGDPALAGAIRGLAGRHQRGAAGQSWSGRLRRSLEAAVYAAEELEETAKLFLLLRGAPTRPLSDGQIEELL